MINTQQVSSRKLLKNCIRSFITYTTWIVTITPIILFFCYPLSLLPRSVRYDNRLYFFFSTIIGRIYTWASFVHFDIQGLENLPMYPESPAIIVMNHTSSFDIPVIENIVGTYPHVWMSKDSYGKIPFFGGILKRMHILVNRNAPRNALLGMYTLTKDTRRHILIFPEGTRYSDGTIHKFYSGFAVLAQKLKRPVIPIVAYGMHTILAKKSLLIDSSGDKVTIIIGKPRICPENMPLDEFVLDVQKHFEYEIAKRQ